PCIAQRHLDLVWLLEGQCQATEAVESGCLAICRRAQRSNPLPVASPQHLPETSITLLLCSHGITLPVRICSTIRTHWHVSLNLDQRVTETLHTWSLTYLKFISLKLGHVTASCLRHRYRAVLSSQFFSLSVEGVASLD